jgi:hypothetical protein
MATADWVSAEAEKMLAEGHRISARDGLMRANNYYRAAEFFLHGNPDDPRIDHAYNRARDCFRAAAALFDPPSNPSKSLTRAPSCTVTSIGQPEVTATPAHARR